MFRTIQTVIHAPTRIRTIIFGRIQINPIQIRVHTIAQTTPARRIIQILNSIRARITTISQSRSNSTPIPDITRDQPQRKIQIPTQIRIPIPGPTTPVPRIIPEIITGRVIRAIIITNLLQIAVEIIQTTALPLPIPETKALIRLQTRVPETEVTTHPLLEAILLLLGHPEAAGQAGLSRADQLLVVPVLDREVAGKYYIE